ncbi:hypothetical protein [Nocardioides psychrotolerans]|uniref:hypothetical protein n=1 Tax=Nocardioides psychrotolerans TaxID=1005945 RepID=UPI0031379E7C
MSVREALVQLGGVATRAALIEVTSRLEVDTALASGEIVAPARGRYAVPEADAARTAAHRVSGAVSHESAALHWGWSVKLPPTLPNVTLPRNRKVTAAHRAGLTLHRANLTVDDVVDGVTSRERTLLDCLRLPDTGAALSVADSALRGGFSHRTLVRLAEQARGPGVLQARRLAGAATHLAANPFESVLRDIAADVPGLAVRPQVPIYGPAEFLGRPDLVDEDLRADLKRDARRYNALVVHGWLVLRFAWEDVMFEAAYVREALTQPGVCVSPSAGPSWTSR